MPTGWIIFFVVLFLVVAAAVIWDKRNPAKVRCVHCNAAKVVEKDRRMLASRTVQMSDGGMRSGGDIRVQQDLEVMFTCQACGKSFSRRITKTS